MNSKTTLLLLVLSFCSVCSVAQHAGAYGANKFKVYEDSLSEIGSHLINDQSVPERINASYTFAKTLVRALKIPRSFNYRFDSLKTIAVRYSPDQRFRIFSWHVMYDDGSYRYYGAIQMNNPDGKLHLFGLVDYSQAIKNPADTVTSNDRWYGAQYYSIIPVTYNVRTPYYILLGWKGNNVKSTKKVIETLYFKDDKPVFGMSVFDGNKGVSSNKRIIFEYSRQASMLLNYDTKTGMIVFDHLAAPDAKMVGNPELYGPDMSYDGYKLVGGRWKLVQDIPLKNPPSGEDVLFNDPKKPKYFTPRKF
ncbi:hypothetical protein GS399_13950 [Pedobacter sp. HMF7647]|uniref:Uncharacterized protein n=1 Tax=Hufsiella arboris TaxID=2695275 RepID=A0A7K1YBW1_9SPHI|nr:hypothetical protein [Hufsiella arboris]MXV52077.1 hypothetical protein [Hufsiella arboris]